jgi:hypothetical protein
VRDPQFLILSSLNDGQVPLDWLDPSDDLRASIAIIRLNATDRKDYKGPVFINPGIYVLRSSSPNIN